MAYIPFNMLLCAQLLCPSSSDYAYRMALWKETMMRAKVVVCQSQLVCSSEPEKEDVQQYSSCLICRVLVHIL